MSNNPKLSLNLGQCNDKGALETILMKSIFICAHIILNHEKMRMRLNLEFCVGAKLENGSMMRQDRRAISVENTNSRIIMGNNGVERVIYYKAMVAGLGSAEVKTGPN